MDNGTYNIFPGNTMIGSAVGDGAKVEFWGNVERSELEYAQIVKAFEKAKRTIDDNSPYYQGLTKIEDGATKRDWGALRSAVSEFIGQFSSATLANLVGGGVLHLLGM